MTVSSKTRKWAIALIGALSLACILILANRTTGWVSALSYGLVITAFVAWFGYAIVSKGPRLDVIDLQTKARPGLGRIEHYWFENPAIGLKRTLFHRIVVPFAPFDSGLEYVSQPEATELVVEWINLGLPAPSDLDDVVIATGTTADAEASIYLGGAHNWTSLKELRLNREGDVFRIRCRATVEFENECVGRNEPFEFQTVAKYVGEA